MFHYIFDLENSKVKVKEAKMPKRSFGHNFAANSPIHTE